MDSAIKMPYKKPLSKNQQAPSTNRIQREFYSNVRIATQELFLASSTPRKNTNFLKPITAPSEKMILLKLRTKARKRKTKNEEPKTKLSHCRIFQIKIIIILNMMIHVWSKNE